MRPVLGMLGVVLAACVLGLAAPRDAEAARLVRVAAFSSPVYVAAPRSARPGTLFVVEQQGRVIRYRNGSRSVFANITGLVSCCGERGLLSIAFHPQYGSNRRVYLFYTDNQGDLTVVEYRARAGGRAIRPSTRRQLLQVRHRNASNHNGGQLAFGPNGLLYAGTGDGGSACDPGGNGQRLSSRLGKVLRINVDTGAIRLFFYGVRNPWRFSFDRRTGNFWLGDVGQGSQEEVDFRLAGQLSPATPWNGGWDVWEGRARSGCSTGGLNRTGRLVRPVSVYSHALGCSITGGYVYRGRAIPSLRGWYVFGDFCSGRIWRLLRRADGTVSRRLLLDTSVQISSFGEGVAGALYVADLGGTIYRLARS